jgi:hypothetical protein
MLRGGAASSHRSVVDVRAYHIVGALLGIVSGAWWWEAWCVRRRMPSWLDPNVRILKIWVFLALFLLRASPTTPT